jgi:hypothetical protein
MFLLRGPTPGMLRAAYESVLARPGQLLKAPAARTIVS